MFEYHDATSQDIPAVVALVESAYRGEASRTGWTSEADFLLGQRTDPEAVQDIVNDPRSRLLLASSGGTLVACCHLENHGDYAYFGMFSVRPEAQAAGIGKAVLAEAERLVREDWGVNEMHMTVISLRNELIAWYERRGYVRTGKMSPFPYGDERFGVPQRDDLEFELLVKTL